MVKCFDDPVNDPVNDAVVEEQFWLNYSLNHLFWNKLRFSNIKC